MEGGHVLGPFFITSLPPEPTGFVAEDRRDDPSAWNEENSLFWPNKRHRRGTEPLPWHRGQEPLHGDRALMFLGKTSPAGWALRAAFWPKWATGGPTMGLVCADGREGKSLIGTQTHAQEVREWTASNL